MGCFHYHYKSWSSVRYCRVQNIHFWSTPQPAPKVKGARWVPPGFFNGALQEANVHNLHLWLNALINMLSVAYSSIPIPCPPSGAASSHTGQLRQTPNHDPNLNWTQKLSGTRTPLWSALTSPDIVFTVAIQEIQHCSPLCIDTSYSFLTSLSIMLCTTDHEQRDQFEGRAWFVPVSSLDNH
jgi:hypothetical protein